MPHLIRVTVILLFLSVSMFLPASPVAAADTTTCDDFKTQEEAQEAWDKGLGRPRADYTTGMDADDDGIPCEHLPTRLERNLRRAGVVVGVVVVASALGYIGNRRIRAKAARRLGEAHFPGRTSRQAVDDELALLQADRSIDRAPDASDDQ